jgi:stress-induced morphogen
MVDPELIRRRITEAMPDALVQVNDLTGGGDHYQVEVVSAAFAGVLPVKRHRMVYATLKDVLGGALHALALTTRTPDELHEIPKARG